MPKVRLSKSRAASDGRVWTRNPVHYNKLDKGGHFAAWEQPQLLSEEVRASFRPLPNSGAEEFVPVPITVFAANCMAPWAQFATVEKTILAN